MKIDSIENRPHYHGNVMQNKSEVCETIDQKRKDKANKAYLVWKKGGCRT